MIISALKETGNETRVSMTPASVKQLINLGFQPHIESDAGLNAGFKNEEYEQAGASVINNRKNLLKNTAVLFCVTAPPLKDLKRLSPNSIIIGPFDKDEQSEYVALCQKYNLSLFSMNLIPRISRAQAMDSLSSQANLAGYRAVIEAAGHFKRAIPMMMTAAGMIHPAKVLILGAGVAGLQAIATAKRLGAVVYAFDVRTAAKEQVESLGAEFIEVNDEEHRETTGGYAGETSEEYKKKQAELIHDHALKVDIIITTALIPGKDAPLLIHQQTVEKMKPGSVVVDLATSRGGNCELSVADKVIEHADITLVGFTHMERLVPKTASDLYANNLIQLMKLLGSSESKIHFNAEDDIIQQALLCHDGRYLPFQQKKETQNA